MIRIHAAGHNGKYHNKTGHFYPMHPEKFIGQYTPIFKSMLEYKLMMYLDRSPAIVKWSYEKFPVTYIDQSSNPPKQRKYWIDFIVIAKAGNHLKTIWIEVKSKRETHKPKETANMNEQKTWVKNCCKWAAAKKLATSKGYDFKIITEEQLD